jgi:hypothetical protein
MAFAFFPSQMMFVRGAFCLCVVLLVVCTALPDHSQNVNTDKRFSDLEHMFKTAYNTLVTELSVQKSAYIGVQEELVQQKLVTDDLRNLYKDMEKKLNDQQSTTHNALLAYTEVRSELDDRKADIIKLQQDYEDNRCECGQKPVHSSLDGPSNESTIPDVETVSSVTNASFTDMQGDLTNPHRLDNKQTAILNVSQKASTRPSSNSVRSGMTSLPGSRRDGQRQSQIVTRVDQQRGHVGVKRGGRLNKHAI